MKKVILLMLITLLYNVAVSQCYEPNIKKADAAYARGDWQRAYEYYKQASKCPDAKNFENGKKAKAGMQKCYPVLKVDGQKELNITIEPRAGERTFKISHSGLSDGWSVGETSDCEMVKEDHRNNTLTIKWDENKMADNREMSFYLYGYGIEYVTADVKITQEGWPDEVVTLPPNTRYDTVVKASSSGISFVMYHGKYGYIDSNGIAITPLKYSYSKNVTWNDMNWNHNTMLMRVYRNGKYGYIDHRGREIVQLKYDTIVKSQLRYGLSTTVVRKDGKYGLLNGKGEEVVPCVYDDYVSNHSDYEPVIFKKNGKWAFFGFGADNGGKLLVVQLTEFKYDWVCTCGFPGYTSLCRVAVCSTKGNTTVYKKGYVNLEGKEVIPPQFDNSFCYGDNNRAAIEINGKYGFINAMGNIVIPCKYDDWKQFREGLAWVKEGNLWRQIDTVGHYVTANGYAKLLYNGKPWKLGFGNYGGYMGCVALKTGNRDTVIIGNYGKEYRSIVEYQNDFDGLVEAAEKGIDACQYALSLYYWDKKNYVKSFEWRDRAAHGGNPDVIARLAHMYSNGIGCKEDDIKALHLNINAASFGHNSLALNNIGYALWHGYGCEKDRETAIAFLFLGALAETGTWALDFLKKQGVDISELKPY